MATLSGLRQRVQSQHCEHNVALFHCLYISICLSVCWCCVVFCFCLCVCLFVCVSGLLDRGGKLQSRHCTETKLNYTESWAERLSDDSATALNKHKTQISLNYNSSCEEFYYMHLERHHGSIDVMQHSTALATSSSTKSTPPLPTDTVSRRSTNCGFMNIVMQPKLQRDVLLFLSRLRRPGSRQPVKT